MSQDKTPTPASDVSPTSQPVPANTGYFDVKQSAEKSHGPVQSPELLESPIQAGGTPIEPAATQTTDAKGKAKDSIDLTGEASATTTNVESPTASSYGGSDELPSRKQSVSSVSFLAPSDPALPKGVTKPHRVGRIRDSSPPHRR